MYIIAFASVDSKEVAVAIQEEVRKQGGMDVRRKREKRRARGSQGKQQGRRVLSDKVGTSPIRSG